MSSPGSAPPPVSTPAPTPSPTPTPTPTSAADSAEYKASGAVVSAKAAYAYDKGITGKGVTVAVLDTGINRSTPEFAGRVSADSTGFDQRYARCATCPAETIRLVIDDVVGHGTGVASIAAAARNGTGVQGLAPDATILALKISGLDLTGVDQTNTRQPSESGTPNPGLIAPALRYALDKGAFVSVLALNGTAGGQIATDMRSAMDAVRQADRLVVQSISNNTGEDSFSGQFAESLVGTDRANKDWFLFATGVDENGNPRTANGNAGPLADRMIAAGGNNVQVVDKDGNYVTVTGNSFAAPAVAGAAALLKQYWPQLGAKAISRILLDTATDAGAPGVDQVYGVGILNVEKAMQAQAPASSFVKAQAVIARWSSLSVSAPFGGASTGSRLNGQLAGLTVFDRYGRDYLVTGEPGIRVRGSGLFSGAGLQGFDVVRGDDPASADRRLGLPSDAPVGPWQGAGSRRPAIASFSAGSDRTITLAQNVMIDGSAGLAGSYLRGVTAQMVGGSAAIAGHGWSVSLSGGSSHDRRAALRTMSVSTPLGLGLELSDLAERGQVLGLGGDGALGHPNSRTTLATVTGQRQVAGMLLSARATVGNTRARDGGDLLRFTGPIVSTAFSLDTSRGVRGGLATVGLSSPLRVVRARASLLAPVSYDLITGALIEQRRELDLGPNARELDLSLGWAAALSHGSSLRLGLVRAFDAGHVAGATDTAGFVSLAIR